MKSIFVNVQGNSCSIIIANIDRAGSIKGDADCSIFAFLQRERVEICRVDNSRLPFIYLI